MFANTLTLTIDGVDHTLTRVNQDNYGSAYKKAMTGYYMFLQIRNAEEKPKSGNPETVDRHNVFFEHTVFATPTETEKYYSVSATLRARRSSDPVILQKDAVGVLNLIETLAAGLAAGES